MGYTHYFSLNVDGLDAAGSLALQPPEEPTASLARAMRDMIAVARRGADRGLTLDLTLQTVEILIAHDTYPAPLLERITLNGMEGDGYEDFVFPPPDGCAHRPKEPTMWFNRKGWRWSFTKTNQRPYDVVIVACLCVAKHHLGDLIEIKTDGDPSDWKAGIQLASDVLGVPVAYPVEESLYEEAPA